jgi:hypothetical protein
MSLFLMSKFILRKGTYFRKSSDFSKVLFNCFYSRLSGCDQQQMLMSSSNVKYKHGFFFRTTSLSAKSSLYKVI